MQPASTTEERNGDDDDGSDSNPSADEKPVLELRGLAKSHAAQLLEVSAKSFGQSVTHSS